MPVLSLLVLQRLVDTDADDVLPVRLLGFIHLPVRVGLHRPLIGGRVMEAHGLLLQRQTAHGVEQRR